MSQTRGKGRIVPRQKRPENTAAQAQVSLTPPLHLPIEKANSGSFVSSDVTSTTQNYDTGLHLAASGTPSSSYRAWRCADVIVAQSAPVKQLQASKLGTGASKQLLKAGEPVLLPGWGLTCCSLNNKHVQPEQQQKQEGSYGAGGISEGAESVSTQHVLQSQQLQQQRDQRQQEQQQKLTVLVSPASTNRFIAADVTKNMPGSYYHLRKPETSSMSLSFMEWMDCWQTWDQNRLLLLADVCKWELDTHTTNSSDSLHHGIKLWPSPATWPHLPQLLHFTQSPPTQLQAAAPAPTPPAGSASQPQHAPTKAAKAYSSAASATSTAAAAAEYGLIDWSLLQQLLRDGHWGSSGSLQLLAGGRDALLPARYETSDRVICQVSGRQQLMLFPPELAFAGVYPYPVHHPYDRYSAVDWEEPELEHWPAAAKVKGVMCDLSPGDSLIVPAYWFVHSQLMQPACLSLTMVLQPQPSRLMRPAALQLQLSRMIEVWFGVEAGPANVRQWLKALSQGQEWELLERQLTTVKGYKLMQCCHMALEHLQKVLSLFTHAGSSDNITRHDDTSENGSTDCSSSSDSSSTGSSSSSDSVSCGDIRVESELEVAARHLLGSMCDERLIPTTWLNEGISDPLYLQHPPRYYLIEEDAEAARYSSLFQHRLIGNRHDWMQHATPLQLAPPGPGKTLKLMAADSCGGMAQLQQ